MDLMLDRLVGRGCYYFLDGYRVKIRILLLLNTKIIPLSLVHMELSRLRKSLFNAPITFSLFNAPITFQRCMMAIFSDMVNDTIEVFMNDFSIIGDLFENFLSNIYSVLRICKDSNLVFNWEKCYFIVKEGIVLGHKILKRGIEVD